MLYQTKKFLHNKGNHQKTEETTYWKNIFTNDTSNKGLISKIYKKITQLNTKITKFPLKNGQRIWINICTKRTYRWLLKMLNVTITSEMQTKTTLKYHLTPVRIAINNKSTDNKCCQGCGKKGTPEHCWWECRLVQPLWKTVWNSLKKWNSLLTQQYHCWDYILRILKHQFRRTYAAQCSE